MLNISNILSTARAALTQGDRSYFGPLRDALALHARDPRVSGEFRGHNT